MTQIIDNNYNDGNIDVWKQIILILIYRWDEFFSKNIYVYYTKTKIKNKLRKFFVGY